MPPTHLAMAREVEQFRHHFEQMSLDADALVAPLSNEQFNWQPQPTSWSVAHCIEHLNTTARLYLPQLDEAIAGAIRKGTYGEGPFSYNVFGRFFTAAMEPPARFRITTPRQFQPPVVRGRSEVMAAFRAYQVQFVDRLRQANGLDGRRGARLFGSGNIKALYEAKEREMVHAPTPLVAKPDAQTTGV